MGKFSSPVTDIPVGKLSHLNSPARLRLGRIFFNYECFARLLTKRNVLKHRGLCSNFFERWLASCSTVCLNRIKVKMAHISRTRSLCLWVEQSIFRAFFISITGLKFPTWTKDKKFVPLAHRAHMKGPLIAKIVRNLLWFSLNAKIHLIDSDDSERRHLIKFLVQFWRNANKIPVTK